MAPPPPRRVDELNADGEARPWGFWMIEQGLSHQPAGEAGELRAIKNLGLYGSDAEREFVQKRAAELRSHWHRRVA